MNTTPRSALSTTGPQKQPRLVLHADCTRCGRLNRDQDASSSVVDIALDHTDGTCHVVVLNGTTDLPGEDGVDAAAISSVEPSLPSIEEVLADPSASCWLRNALLAALSRDPVDAVNEAEILARLLDRRCREILTETSHPGSNGSNDRR
jgi:hypothetical protein